MPLAPPSARPRQDSAAHLASGSSGQHRAALKYLLKERQALRASSSPRIYPERWTPPTGKAWSPTSFTVGTESYARHVGRYGAALSARHADAAGLRALDVECGPSALLAELARRLGPDRVAGVDPSQPFVEQARAAVPGADVHLAPLSRCRSTTGRLTSSCCSSSPPSWTTPAEASLRCGARCTAPSLPASGSPPTRGRRCAGPASATSARRPGLSP